MLTTGEVAARLRVAPAKLRFWRWKGLGPASFRIVGRVVYGEAVVAAGVDEQAQAAGRA